MEIENAKISGSVNSEIGLAIASDDKDFRILKADFCKCDTISENLDYVERSEVEIAKESVVATLANIDHNFSDNVGAISEPLDCSTDKPTVKVKISSIKYPEKIKKIENKINSKGGLPVSFETSFKHAYCMECGEDMGANSSYSKFYSHLGDKHPDKKFGEVGRKLKKLTFQGVGILLNLDPGFPGVKALALANKNLKERSVKMAEENDKNKEHDAVLAMAALKTEIDGHVKRITELEKMLNGKDAEIQDHIKKHDSVKSEFEGYRTAVELEKRVNSHFESATKQGLTFDDEKKKDLEARFKRWSAEDSEAYISDLAKAQAERQQAIDEAAKAKDTTNNDKDKVATANPAQASKVPKPYELDSDAKPKDAYQVKGLDEKFFIVPKIKH